LEAGDLIRMVHPPFNFLPSREERLLGIDSRSSGMRRTKVGNDENINKMSPFHKGRVRGIWENLPSPLFRKEGE